MSCCHGTCVVLTGLVGICVLIIFKWLYKIWKSDEGLLSLKNKTVVVTGGSSGIGLSLAKLAYSYGAHVTIIARNVVNLKKAEEEIRNQNCVSIGQIKYLSVDLTIDYYTIEKQLKQIIGLTDILINCAGGALSKDFHQMDPENIETQMRLNYLASAHVTRIMLPAMLETKTQCRVTFVSSMAGQVGIYGLASYSASKFALRGLAECLQMEVANRGVSVTLAFPPDTATPGFDKEQIGKPEITKKLSSAGGLLSPDVVALSIMKSTLKGEFFSSVGLDGWLLTQLTYGMCLPHSVIDFVTLVFLSPILRIISIGYGLWMRYVVSSNT